MHKAVVKYFLIIILFHQISFGQEIIVEVEPSMALKTVFLRNSKYLVANNWPNIPINIRTGEDMNSETFGVPYYPLYTDEGRGVLESRTTLANQELEIWVQVINSSNEHYLLKSVDIVVLYTFPIPESYELGTWRPYDTRTNDYSPEIYLSLGNLNDISVLVDKVVRIDPIKNGTSDSRFRIRFKNSSSAPIEDNIIYFALEFKLQNVRKPMDSISIRSDRNYFLGFVRNE